MRPKHELGPVALWCPKTRSWVAETPWPQEIQNQLVWNERHQWYEVRPRKEIQA